MEALEIEVLGVELLADSPSAQEIRRLCELALAAAHVSSAHLAVEFVDAERIARLNSEYRGKPQPTDVLSFPIDGIEGLPVSLMGASGETATRWKDSEPAASPGMLPQELTVAGWSASVPRELGDVVICPEHASDVRAAVVHGVLHLLGMDHETDGGEMLALQARLLGPRDA